MRTLIASDLEKTLEEKMPPVVINSHSAENLSYQLDEFLCREVQEWMRQNPIAMVDEFSFSMVLVDGDGPIEGMASAKRGKEGKIFLIVPEENLSYAFEEPKLKTEILSELIRIIIKTVTHEAVHWLQMGRTSHENPIFRGNHLYSEAEIMNIKIAEVFGIEQADYYFADKMEVEAMAHTAAQELIDYWIKEGCDRKTSAKKSLDIIRRRDHINWIIANDHSEVMLQFLCAIEDSPKRKAPKVWNRFLKEIFKQLEARNAAL